ncbi:MAG: squalene/phytoene synthase family protein [Candidatus Micrarchaeota archaeon]|nr:squalene/phytoene synthase family protein [Candidatus Micrarchaeota archaeon]
MIEHYIILKSSKTYGISNMMFPGVVRDKISTLYSFLRIVDNFVDVKPFRIDLLYKAKDYVLNNIDHKIGEIENRVLENFCRLVDESGIEREWIEAFFRSMEWDTQRTEYTYRELLEYMYGSAEIVGMSIARIIGLNNRSMTGARLLGRGMQMINFVRDVFEDLGIGRIYIPKDHRDMFSVDITRVDENWIRLIRMEIDIAWGWIEQSKRYFIYIPNIYLIPIRTATELYQWIAYKIYENPTTIKRKKIRPTYSQAILYAFKNRILH